MALITQSFEIPAGDSRVIPIGIVEVFANGTEGAPNVAGLVFSVREVVRGALRVASDVTLTTLLPAAYETLPAVMNGYPKTTPLWYSLNIGGEVEPKIPQPKRLRVFRVRVTGLGIDTMYQIRIDRP